MFTNSYGLLVVGSRGISDYQMFSQKLDFLLQNIEQWDIHIITGDNKGVDEMARRYANEHGFEIHTFYARWDEYGKSAGYKRNAVMFKYLIDNFQNLGCCAFWDGQSKGTQHSINLAKFYQIPLRIVKPNVKHPVELPEMKPEFVQTNKWFQDEPNLSKDDKDLIKRTAEPKMVNDKYLETDADKAYAYAERIERRKLLKRARKLAEKYGIWYEPESIYE